MREYSVQLFDRKHIAHEQSVVGLNLHLPDACAGIFDVADDGWTDEAGKRHSLAYVQVTPHEGRWTSVREVVRVAENCRQEMFALNWPFGFTFGVVVQEGNLLQIEILESGHFHGARRMIERTEYARSVETILEATLVDPDVRRTRNGHVRATLEKGPWGQSLWSPPWETHPNELRRSIRAAAVDTIVLPLAAGALWSYRSLARRNPHRPRVINFSELADESFDWQITEVAQDLMVWDGDAG